MEEEDRIVLSEKELLRLKKPVAEARQGDITDLIKFNDLVNKIVGKKIELELPEPVTKAQVNFKLTGNKGQRRSGILDILDERLNKVLSVSEIDNLGAKFYARLISYAFEHIIFLEKDAVNADMANRITAVLEEISKQKNEAGMSARVLLFWKEGMFGRYSGLLQTNGYKNGTDEIVDMNLIRSAILGEDGLVYKLCDYGQQNGDIEGFSLDNALVRKTFSDLKDPEKCFESVNNLILALKEKTRDLVNVQRWEIILDAGVDRLTESAI